MAALNPIVIYFIGPGFKTLANAMRYHREHPELIVALNPRTGKWHVCMNEHKPRKGR